MIFVAAGLLASVMMTTTMPAQSSRVSYARNSDTLRYRERTDGHVVIALPQSPVQVRTEHDATIAVRFGTADTATAWYEALRLRQVGPGSTKQAPATDALLRQPFVLRFLSSGQMETYTVPALPRPIADITDLGHQFDDFFVTLPPAELVAGVTWADTLTQSRPTRPADTYVSRRIRRYRVDRDTVVGGSAAVVIRVEQEMHLESTSQPDGQPGMTVGTVLEGREEGIVVFAPASGRLLSRERRGKLTGQFMVRGGSQPATFPQTYEYTSTLVLQM
jgi:hypothetical protein